MLLLGFVCRVLWSKVKCFENEAEKARKKSRQKRQTQDFWWLLSGILVSLLVFVCCNFLEGGSFDLQWILKQFVGLFPIVINGCVYSSTNTVSKKLFLFSVFFLWSTSFWSTHFQVQVALLFGNNSVCAWVLCHSADRHENCPHFWPSQLMYSW